MDLFYELHQRLRRAESEDGLLTSELNAKGFSVVDNALPPPLLRALAEEVLLAEEAMKSSPSKLSTSADTYVVLTKPHVYELSIVERSKLLYTNKGLLSLLPLLSSMWTRHAELTHAFQSSCAALAQLERLDQVKVAIIKKGGCFPVHTDTSPGTGRTLSVTLYLDESDFEDDKVIGYKNSDNKATEKETGKEDRGNKVENNNSKNNSGSLRIYPFPPEATGPIDIAPLFGRMVLFSACNIYHRVMPGKNANRLCLSLMFYGGAAYEQGGKKEKGLVDADRSTAVIDIAAAAATTNYTASSLSPSVRSFPFPQQPFPSDFFELAGNLTPLLYFDHFRESILEAFGGNMVPITAVSGGDEGVEGHKDESDVDKAVRYFTTKCYSALSEGESTSVAASPLWTRYNLTMEQLRSREEG